VSLQKKFKFSVKNFISNNLSIFKRIKLFQEYYSSVSRLNLYKKNSVKIEKSSELFKKNPGNFENLENLEIDENINSVAGWLPITNNKLNIVLYNFFSINYSLRKQLILRITLLKNKKEFNQRFFSIPVNFVKELSIDRIFNKSLKNYNSIILELFHPLFEKNHAGNDGHLRFIGKYSEDDKVNCMVHSMPISKYYSVLEKSSDWARTYTISDFANYSFYNNYYSGKIQIKNNDTISKKTNYGFLTVEDTNYNKIVSIFHQSPKNQTLDVRKISSGFYCPNDKINSYDPFIFIDEKETNCSENNFEFLIYKNNSVTEKRIIKNHGNYLERISKIFGKFIDDDYFFIAKMNTTSSNAYFHVHFADKYKIYDQVHTENVNWDLQGNNLLPILSNDRKSCRKFCSFDLSNNKKNLAVIYLNKVKNLIQYNLKLRILVEDKEYLKSITFKIKEPIKILHLNNILRDFGILNNSKGVIQIESLDQNFAAINYQINDNSTISADHFTGG